MVTIIKTRQKPAWLNTVKARFAALDLANNHHAAPMDACKDCDRDTARRRPASASVLGILSFEAARSMSRLISLYRSLSEAEIFSLRSSTMRSKGVAYLNSVDQPYLLRLACAEMLEELDAAAEAVSRLSSGTGGRCKVARQQLGAWPPEFRRQYEDLKMGNAGRLAQMAGTHRDVEKKVRKMAGYVGTTATLHEEMETLAEMEASERKLQKWRDYSGPMTPTAAAAAAAAPPNDPPGADLFLKRLAMQRRKVHRVQDDSLWRKTTDNVVELMAGAIVAIFARICSVFSTVVTQLPYVSYDRDGRPRFSPNRHQLILQTVRSTYPYPNSSSGPLERNPPPPMTALSSSGPLFNSAPGMMPQGPSSGPILRGPPLDPFTEAKPWTARELQAPPTTVGGAGLSLRYAHVVRLAQRMLMQPDCVGEDTREELYGMLPGAIRTAVRQKLLGEAKSAAAHSADVKMAQGWRDAAGRILDWLAPMAHDTIKWHSERSCERQRLEPVSEEHQQRVLLLQTLYFSDRDKADAAIVEVLVGLSCVCRYQYGAYFHRDPSSADDDDFLHNLDS